MALLRTGLLCGVALLGACTERAASPAAPTPAPALDAGVGDAAAVVNGRPITRFEVLLRLRSMPDATPQQALDAIIVDELRAQRAAELGLERDPAYLQELARVQAQVNEVTRRELSKLFFHREVLGRAEATDDEVKAWVAQHRARFTHRVKVLQLLRKDRAAIDALKAELDRGARFEDLVLSTRSGPAPGTLAEATVGPLSWEQVPPAWWRALEVLQPGQVSEVLAPPGGPFTLLKLLEREPAAEPPFEQLAPMVRATLKAERIESLKVSTDEALRKAGQVVQGAPMTKL